MNILIVCVVKKIAHILEAKEPCVRQSAGSVKDLVGCTFNGLVVPLSGVLLLVIRFTLPTIDAEGMKDVLIPNNDLSTITNEFVWCATLGDTVLQCIDKCLIKFDTMDVNNLGVNANKDYSGNGPIINSRNISIHNITCDRFIMASGIESRVRRSKCKVFPMGNQSYWVECWKVFLMMSGGSHPKRGRMRTKSGSFLRMEVADVVEGDDTTGGVFSSVT
jgi:hypothetical protein